MDRVVIIAGSGKLADSMLKELPGRLTGCHFDTWENHESYSEMTPVIVHIGSGRQLPEVIDFCERTKSPLIQGSTGMNTGNRTFDFTFIDAPNFNILMLKFMHMLKEYGSFFKDYNISVTESHQHSKKTVPGTAVEIACSLGVDRSEIRSVRDPEVQANTYGIPSEHLELHAFHDICIQEDGVSINFKTMVKGHEAYVNGLVRIIRSIPDLHNRYYHVLDLIAMRIV